MADSLSGSNTHKSTRHRALHRRVCSWTKSRSEWISWERGDARWLARSSGLHEGGGEIPVRSQRPEDGHGHPQGRLGCESVLPPVHLAVEDLRGLEELVASIASDRKVLRLEGSRLFPAHGLEFACDFQILVQYGFRIDA